jgi:5-methylcytosine-specific restriction endonuclease McrA
MNDESFLEEKRVYAERMRRRAERETLEREEESRNALPVPSLIRRTARNVRLRRRTFGALGFCCYYCGVEKSWEELTIDHLTPKALGGDDSKKNLVPACEPCNIDKGDMTLEQYRDFKRGQMGDEAFRFAGEMK